LGYTPAQKKTSFISGVRHDILNDIFAIGYHKPINDILDSLEEMELRSGILGPPPSYLSYTQAPPTISNIAPQQQGISLEDMQKAIQNALSQQKTEYQSLLEKQRSDFQSQMAQQVSTPQTVEPVRQPKGPPSSLKSEEDLKNYYVAEYLKEVGLLNKEDLDSDYPVKPFQRSRPQQNNNSVRFDRIEEGLEETRNNVNQLADLFQKKAYIRKCGICSETGHSKGNCPNRPVAQSNFTRSLYFTPLKPIVPPDSDGEENDGDGYDEDNNRWTGYDPPVKKTGK
jgi:hypothetical protein